ncbi:BatA and WFA domain-containing protein [Luteolibacter sp. Populi]|uniref:vWA domain-containing protein n=1 Tax=Luteolibacter sp. Populi TaxID=3230487 RepID=UPI003467983D
MSLFFQHPALFGLLALGAVPLLVHLLSRAKPPQYRFSNVEFLKKVMRLTSRLRKPKDWLLLALRTLAILAIVAAFLGPMLLSKNAPLPGEKRTVVILIDRSASMAAKEGAASRFEAACAAAGEMLESGKPDAANIVWIDAAPDAVFPDPAPNREFLEEELTRAAPRPEAGAPDAALELALRQLAGAQGRKELIVISDFQATAWKGFSPVVPQGVELQMVPVAKEDAPNMAVTSLVPLPAAPVAGQQLVAQCRVANHSDEARRVSLTLDAGGSRQSQALDLPPRGEAEAAFTVRCPTAGLMPLTAEIDADSFPGDDKRHAVVRVRESIRLAITGPPDSPAAQTLARVAKALPWLEALPLGSEGKIPACEIICLPGWDGSAPEKLNEWVEQGTALIVFPGPAAPASSLATLFHVPADPAAEAPGLETSETGWEASPVAERPAFRLFAGGEFGNPLGGKFKQRTRMSAPGPADIIARFSDGKPALLQAKTRPLMVSNLSLDPAVSAWPAEPAFLPGIAELLLHLLPSKAAEGFEVEAGGKLAWTNPAGDAAGTPVLRAPDGSAWPLVAAGETWHSDTPAVPGIYQWLVSEQPVHLSAVNFPESESRLKPLDAVPDAGPAAASGKAAARAALAGGMPLWPWLMAAALALLLVEGVIAGWRPAARNA